VSDANQGSMSIDNLQVDYAPVSGVKTLTTGDSTNSNHHLRPVRASSRRQQFAVGHLHPQWQEGGHSQVNTFAIPPYWPVFSISTSSQILEKIDI
jgi:hypothetical protein